MFKTVLLDTLSHSLRGDRPMSTALPSTPREFSLIVVPEDNEADRVLTCQPRLDVYA